MSDHFRPLISVVIPVYNGADYMRQAIDSALDQTYDNVEVIVVNDGSNDNGATEAIALSYGGKIRYFAKENGGVATAVNLAISHMRGEYFAWLAHDDWWEHNKLAKLTAEAARSGTGKFIFTSRCINYKQSENIMIEPDVLFDVGSLFDILSNMFTPRVNLATMLIPRRAFNEVGLFDPECRTTQDYDLIFRLIKAGYTFIPLDSILTVRRIHDQMGTLALVDIHIQELEFLYLKYIACFFDDISAMRPDQINNLYEALLARGLTESTRRLCGILQWKQFAAGQFSKPMLWLYWENKPNSLPPRMILDSWRSITWNCQEDFEIIILDDLTVTLFLSNIHPTVWKLTQIAHRADYFRFMLLFQYGGVWLDSDTMLFKSIIEVVQKVHQHGFVCTGYVREGALFPLIGFLGAAPGDLICRKMIDSFNSFFDDNALCRRQPAWDELGGYQLASCLKESVYADYYIYPVEFLCPLPLWWTPEILFMPSTRDSRRRLRNAYGQSLCFSVTNVVYDFFNKEHLRPVLNLGVLYKLSGVEGTCHSYYRRLKEYNRKYGLRQTYKKVVEKICQKIKIGIIRILIRKFM